MECYFCGESDKDYLYISSDMKVACSLHIKPYCDICNEPVTSADLNANRCDDCHADWVIKDEHADWKCESCGSSWVRYEHIDGKDCDESCEQPCLIRCCNEEECAGIAINTNTQTQTV